MNRILFEPSELDNGTVVFGGVRAEHVLNVLHGEVGQTLKTGVVNGKIGTSVIAEIVPLPPDPDTKLLQGKITVHCVHEEDSLAPWVDLLLAPPRPRVMKRLLPQLASMGVHRIVLVGAEKVEKAFWGAQLLKPEVYRPLLIDGLMQAGTTALPEIRVERSFRRYVDGGGLEKDFAGRGNRIVAHPYRNSSSMQAPRLSTVPMVLAIGPEGGWLDSEVELLEAHGFSRYSLGSRILRTDTAAISLLARFMPSE